MPLGQSQKEATVNESLAIVDMLLCGVVESVRNDPPATPQAGSLFIVGDQPTGAFAGHALQLAGWTDGGWRFTVPVTGMRVYDRQTAVIRSFNGEWRGAAAIASATGGAVVDEQVRLTVAAILDALRSNGIIATS